MVKSFTITYVYFAPIFKETKSLQLLVSADSKWKRSALDPLKFEMNITVICHVLKPGGVYSRT